MKLSNYFELSRCWLLLKLELFKGIRGIGMTLVIIFGFLFFVGIILEPVMEPIRVYDSHPAGYAFSLIIGGFILSSLAFKDLGSTLRKYHYLALPATSLEKFLCMWLLTSVGWITFFTVAFTLYTLIANQVGALLFSHITYIAFDPFDDFSLAVMRYYFVLQGIFLVGAVHFKGYVLPKTLFTLILFAMVCFIIAYFIMRDTMTPDMEEILSKPDFLDQRPVHQVWQVAMWLFWWVLAPLCWVATYFGLKEQEA